MTPTVTRRKIEILVDAPLVRRVVAAAEAVGIAGYTLLPTLGGAGRSGPWTDDQVTGAEAKIMFVTVTSSERCEQLITTLAPLLESYGLVLLASDVAVVRGARF